MPTNNKPNGTITPACRWQLIADACKAINCNLAALDGAQELDAAGVAADAKITIYSAWAAVVFLGVVAQARVAALCLAAADETVQHPAADGEDAEGKED